MAFINDLLDNNKYTEAKKILICASGVAEQLNQEVYAVGGLDGGDFTEDGGIRGGREAAYPGFEKPSITGRADYFGIDGLRVGGGFYIWSSRSSAKHSHS